MKLYMINLDRSKDRLEHVSKVFAQCDLEFIRVSAVDGRLLDEKEFERLTATRNWDKVLSKSEVGCFLSHRECLRLIAEGDDPYGAIFEDDVLLSPHAATFLKDWAWIPKHIDIVKIDTALKSCLVSAPYHHLPHGYRLGRLISKHYCAGGYIVSKQCAQKLYALTELATAPIDELYFNPDCNILQTLHVGQMMPAIVVQAGLESTIRSAPVIDKNRISSKLALHKKLIREIKRADKKSQLINRLRLIGRSRWGIIPFS